jgi:L-fucose mutarotase
MLKTNLLHPEILNVLASNGHGSMVLIADGNYPFTTGVNERSKKVFLNLAPGLLTVTEVLKVIKDSIPIELYTVMEPTDGTQQPIYTEFMNILGKEIPVEKLARFDFYKKAHGHETCLVIATGERRRFANILLVIGVVKE